jgi:hypothetical protein
VERVPLKVVPIYVHPIEDEFADHDAGPDGTPADEVVEEEPARRPRTPAFAISAVVLAAVTIAVHIAAIVVAIDGDFPLGTLLGYLAIGTSALAVIVGIVAVVIGRGRGWAFAAVLVAILANPVVLLAVLRALSGLQTT